MSSEVTFKQVFEAPDGTRFETKSEVIDYLRKPKVLAALNLITSNQAELNEWIYSHQDFLEEVFSTGTIQRVTKSEKKAIEKAFEALKEVENLPKACAFLVENAGAFQDSFRWPAVKRMKDEEKDKLIFDSIYAATENNKELTEWIIAQKLAIFEAFDAGKVKREVSPKAAAGLEAYRAAKKAEKEAKEAQTAGASEA